MEPNKISLGTKTIQDILTYIDQNHLKAGDKLPTEGQWRKLLGCGRSTIREAMKVLAHSKVVVIKQGAGTFVNHPQLDVNFNQQLRSTIKMLENEAIRELIRRSITDDEWLILKATLSRRNQLLTAGHFDAFIDTDLKFHQQIIKMSGNDYLIDWYHQLQHLWKNFISQIVVSHEQYRGNTQLHDQLFTALVNRQAKSAINFNNQLAK